MVARSQLRLGRADNGLKLSREDYAEAIYEEPWRYERVAGRLSVMPPSGQAHVESSEPFFVKLAVYKDAHPERVDLVVPEAWIAIDDQTDRIADLAVYLKSSRGRRPIPERIPELVYEIASEGYTSLKRDYEEKRDDYWRAGVREYVIIDRFERRVTVLRRSRGKFTETRLEPGDLYTTSLLPGLEIALEGVIS